MPRVTEGRKRGSQRACEEAIRQGAGKGSGTGRSWLSPLPGRAQGWTALPSSRWLGLGGNRSGPEGQDGTRKTPPTQQPAPDGQQRGCIGPPVGGQRPSLLGQHRPIPERQTWVGVAIMQEKRLWAGVGAGRGGEDSGGTQQAGRRAQGHLPPCCKDGGEGQREAPETQRQSRVRQGSGIRDPD